MSRPLFLHIIDALGEWSAYFTRRDDICCQSGLSPKQKCSVAICMLMCGCMEDAVDQYAHRLERAQHKSVCRSL
jgi:hypothetical protein